MSSDFPHTESEQLEAAEAAGRAMANSHDDERCDSNHGERRISAKKKISTHNSALQYLVTERLHDPDHWHETGRGYENFT